MTIEEFIAARLDEDERDAKNTSGTAAEREWVYGLGRVSDTGEYGALHAQTYDPRDGVHIARHDPSRVLREVAAKRKALEVFRDKPSALDVSGMMRHIALREFVIKPMAAIWSDHPDYQEGWAK